MRMRGTQGKRGRVTVDKSGLGAKVKKKKKRRGRREKLLMRVHVRAYTHLSHCVPDAAELGELVDPFLPDDRAVHIEAHRFRSPEELLCFGESCHRAGTISKTV